MHYTCRPLLGEHGGEGVIGPEKEREGEERGEKGRRARKETG